MKAEWWAAQCILCLDKGPLCEEHLIPRSIGGILTCRFLCQNCNSTFGHSVDVSAKQDPSVLLAVRELRNEIPVLYHRLVESRPHVSIGEAPHVVGRVRDSEFQISSQKLDDGSIIRPSVEAPRAIETMLRRQGNSESTINAALNKLDSMPLNRRTNIAPGLDVISRTPKGIELDLSNNKHLDPRLPAKIAFEFFALCVGNAIYTPDQLLSELRQMFQRGPDLDESLLRVDRLRTGTARPFHGICVESNSEYAQMQIRLFGCLAYRVHFVTLPALPFRFVYTNQLDTRVETVRQIANDEW